MSMIKKIVERIFKIIELERKNKNYYQYFELSTTKQIDNMFARQDDCELTEEQIKAIDDFWGKYKFAYPKIDYNSFKIFMNRSGKFSVYHCPPGIRIKCFNKYLVDNNYSTCFQNKGYLQKLYNVKQPRTLVRRMNGLYYDENYNLISIKRMLNICYKAIANGAELVIKPSGKGGGRGIIFINEADRDAIWKAIEEQGVSQLVIQEVLKQSSTMARFNPSSVNTLRVTTLLHKGAVRILGALVRVGAAENRVDNWCSGGSLVGIDIVSGYCQNWALRKDNERITVLPSGLDLEHETFKIPNIEKVWELVKKAHFQIPYVRLISWDIAIDENEEPVMIENNFAGMLQIHEAVTGPIFGEWMEELLDEYCFKRFYLQRATLRYDYKEYHDHIVIEKCYGFNKKRKIPKRLSGKPVTEVCEHAFSN